MLKRILELNGIQKLDKDQQKQVLGSGPIGVEDPCIKYFECIDAYMNTCVPYIEPPCR